MNNNSSPGKPILNKRKLAHAKLVVRKFSIDEIAEKSLSNLARWKAQGVWCPAYDMWQTMMETRDTDAILDAMIGESERSYMLRQSSPYVGLLKLDLTPEQEALSDKILKMKK